MQTCASQPATRILFFPRLLPWSTAEKKVLATGLHPFPAAFKITGTVLPSLAGTCSVIQIGRPRIFAPSTRIVSFLTQSVGSATAATSFSWVSTTNKPASSADKRHDIVIPPPRTPAERRSHSDLPTWSHPPSPHHPRLLPSAGGA